MPRHGKANFAKPKNAKKTISRLLSYLGKNKARLILVLCFVILSCAAQIGATMVIKPIVNNLQADAAAGDFALATSHLITSLVQLLCLYLFASVTMYLQSRIMISVGQRTVNSIRKDLFDKMQSLPIRYFDTHTHGELMSRYTNDMDTISESLNNSITQLLTSSVTLIGTFAAMLYLSPLLTLIALIIVPLMMWIASAIIKRSKKYFRAQQDTLGAVNGYIEEMIGGQKVVKVFCYEDEAKSKFKVINEAYRKAGTTAQIFSGLMMPIMMNMNIINYAISAAAGGLLILRGVLTIGDLSSFLILARQFGRPINEISTQLNAIQSGLAGAERIFEVMDELPEAVDKDDAIELKDIKGDVELSHVTFGYVPEKTILKDISLYAKPGQKIAFVGSTGAGKTTITNLLTRFYDIDSGTITIDGINIQDISRSSLRKNISMVLQDTHLFTGTVMENIRYGRLDATDEECIKAAELASASHFIKRLPHGYNTMLTGDGENLSQGQRQLLNIARAAVADPSILILDEATSSVDSRTERHIQHGMDRLMEGRTTFVIAHRLSTIANSDAIMVIENGEIIERGNHEELLAQKGKYYQLYTGNFDDFDQAQ